MRKNTRRKKTKKKTKTATTPSLGTLTPARSRLRLPVLLVWLLACLAVASLAGSSSADQKAHNKPYALIFGTVWGPDGRPVYGMKIRIRRQKEKKARWELYSDHNGEFAQRVPAGAADYVITADVKAYKPWGGRQHVQGEEVTVHIEYDEKVDTGLHLSN